MPQSQVKLTERFSLLLDEYIGFISDLPVDAEFDGHFLLEKKINRAGKLIGLGPVFKRTEHWTHPRGGSFSVPSDASDELWDRIRTNFGDIEEKGYKCKISLTVQRPHGIGFVQFHDLPLSRFRNKENLPRRDRQPLVATLREWQRAARTRAAEADEAVKPTVRRGMKKSEANILAREYLRDHPTANIRAVAKGIGCSTGLVSKLTAWKAVQEERNRRRRPPRTNEISLTGRMQKVLGVDDDPLRKLIADQEADAEPSPLEDGPTTDRQGAPRQARVYRRR